MPNVVVIAGPNGAGKSTLAPVLLRDTFGITEYVNADVIAEGLSAYAPENAAIDAGRAMLARLMSSPPPEWIFLLRRHWRRVHIRNGSDL